MVCSKGYLRTEEDIEHHNGSYPLIRSSTVWASSVCPHWPSLSDHTGPKSDISRSLLKAMEETCMHQARVTPEDEEYMNSHSQSILVILRKARVLGQWWMMTTTPCHARNWARGTAGCS